METRSRTHLRFEESDQAPLSVTEVNTLFRDLLEAAIPWIRFVGEIAQIDRPASGHLYLRIKDGTSELSAVMWKGPASGLSFRPESGMSVLCEGKPSVYQKTGRLQLVLHRMSLAGEGELFQQFLALKKKLEHKGYFASERKRAIPFLPKGIGIVSSKTGAVIHDIMAKIRERFPSIPCYLVDVRVQGPGSAEEISAALGELAMSGLVDVIILARGGGSLQDLWSFNEEAVVEAVFRCPIPVVCGVGHEPDVTLADLAADCRAPTPTAAAEMVVPKRDELLGDLASLEKRMKNFDRWLSPFSQQLDEQVLRLQRAFRARLEMFRLELSRSEAKLRLLEPKTLLDALARRLDHEAVLLGNAMRNRLREQDAKLRGLEQTLEALCPTRVLERGYALVSHKKKLLRSARSLQVGDELHLRFAEGEAQAKVESIS